ncbi:MAG: sigma-54-dependent Fis family transcriptional regulator [Myxococcota bacterium]
MYDSTPDVAAALGLAYLRPVDGEETGGLLLELAALLRREIAIDELLQRLVERMRTALDADRGTLYLLDRRRRELVSKAADLPELPEIRLGWGQGVAGHVAQTGAIVNVPTATQEVRFFDDVDRRTGYSTESILAAPVRDSADEIIGVVQLLNKRGGRFPAEDETRLGALARQAGLVLHASTLYPDLAHPPASTPSVLPPQGQFHRIVGTSERMREVGRLTQRVAATQATVLLRGESGTGKELFARAIHVNSPRSSGPFVKVDCASLPEALIENELFGHERGAYTGAEGRSEGRFDQARGGTIFLDEIGEMPVTVQGKLLRVLQDKAFDRVGGTQPVTTDARVVAATNRNLERLVEQGRFRGDLYYRIKVVQLILPPLRERGAEDILRLAEHFVRSAGRRHGRKPPRLSEAVKAKLVAYPWPGNVRELENCIESAVVVTEGDTLEPADLALTERPPRLTALHDGAPGESFAGASEATPPASSPVSWPSSEIDGPIETLAEVERRHILAVLERVGGHRSQAAQRLGIGRNTLTRKLKQYGL